MDADDASAAARARVQDGGRAPARPRPPDHHLAFPLPTVPSPRLLSTARCTTPTSAATQAAPARAALVSLVPLFRERRSAVAPHRARRRDAPPLVGQESLPSSPSLPIAQAPLEASLTSSLACSVARPTRASLFCSVPVLLRQAKPRLTGRPPHPGPLARTLLALPPPPPSRRRHGPHRRRDYDDYFKAYSTAMMASRSERANLVHGGKSAWLAAPRPRALDLMRTWLTAARSCFSSRRSYHASLGARPAQSVPVPLRFHARIAREPAR